MKYQEYVIRKWCCFTYVDLSHQSILADRGIAIKQAKGNPGTCQSENLERHMLVLYEAPDMVMEQRWGNKEGGCIRFRD